jgi:SAM-dependent methyltransferase
MAERSKTESPAVEDWAGEMGERWLANADGFEGMLTPISEALLKHAAFRPGERVIDIGCGTGQTSIAIAHQVVLRGSVLGVDISPHLIAAASQRAQKENTVNVSFRCADATTVVVEGPPFDRLFSRFGLMFFKDAYAAFANLHTLIRQGGRADFSVWAPARENSWIVQVMGIIGKYVELPTRPPRAPGPFALDDPDYVRELLSQAGFGTPDFETWQGNQPVGGPGASPRLATVFVLETMGFGQVLDQSAPETRAKVTSELEALFARNHTAKGVEMAGKAYFVNAVA